MKHLESCKPRLPAGQARNEQGFVQGVLLFALAVLVAIIAAFAFANNGNQSSSERENAKVTATVLMKQASDVQDAVSRFISDGQSLMYLCVTSGVSATVSPGTVSTGNCAADVANTPVDLWSQANGYISPPEAPAAAFKSNEAARNWKYANFSADGRTLTASATDPGSYAFMEANNVDKKVCQAISRLLNHDFPFTKDERRKEQCYSSGADTYVYRKVIATREVVGL